MNKYGVSAVEENTHLSSSTNCYLCPDLKSAEAIYNRELDRMSKVSGEWYIELYQTVNHEEGYLIIRDESGRNEFYPYIEPAVEAETLIVQGLLF